MGIDKDLEELKNLLMEEGRGLKYDEIVDALNWGTKQRKKIKSNLSEWVFSGEITINKKNRYNLPVKKEIVKGTVSMISDRFAFVDTEKEGIYISHDDLGTAVDGDIVYVRIKSSSDKNKKKEGEIVKIIKRNRDTVVGVFEIVKDFGFVLPTNNFGKDIYISSKYFMGAKNKQLVEVKIINWGSEDKNPEGEIIKVIGDSSDTENLLRALLFNEGLSETFPDEVLEEAKTLKGEITEKELANRTDLRDLPIITIDGEDAKDLDDAVYVKKLDNGNYQLIVSIADVSHYIKENSLLDVEAYKRGNSVYMVDRVLPMLPKEISNGICSLNEKEDKLTFSCKMEIGTNGEIIDHEIYQSIINSCHRMTYTDVNKIIDGDQEISNKYSDIKDLVFQMLELSHILRNRKHQSGCIDFDIPEIRVILDEDNKKVKEIKTRERGEAEKLIEDFMVAANETVAEELFYAEIPSIYRTHEKPDPEKITSLNKILRKFGYRLSQYDGLHPKQFQEIIEKSKEDGTNLLIHKMILISLKQAQYTVDNLGHFGLASKCYTHFTSPIRRYSDLIVHRILNSALKGYPTSKQIEKYNNKLPYICEHISKTERIAMKIEEDSTKIKIIEYMQDKLGEEYLGTIVGFSKKKVFFNTEENIECFWNIIDAENYYEFDEDNYVMVDKSASIVYNIGDKYPIRIVRASLSELEIEVVLVTSQENR
ncbi:MAG: ribonuclease R [Fusobacteriaceae bacterium]|jgi:ribonuclease R|nr:ribonuclease R [Fusobacteriaceae bacterium]